jgi:hypothetical protein
VIWPGFDSIALLIPATLQRNMLYAAQASSSCSFDRHFLKYASAVQNAQADNAAFILCIICIICIIRIIWTTPPLLPARLWGRAPWCSQNESIVLLFATNTNPV